MRKLYRWILIIALLGASCVKSPLSTRNGEPPAGVVGTWETPASPEAVIRNFLFAYNEKFIQNYQSCFSEDFVYSSPEDSIRAETQGSGYLFQYWNKSVEMLTAQNIFSTYNAPGRRLDLIMAESSSNPDSIGDTVAVVYREYTLRVVLADSLGADTTIMTGLASFRLNQAMLSFWTINLWKDIPDRPEAESWGKFKASFRR